MLSETIFQIEEIYSAARAHFESLSPTGPNWAQLEKTLNGDVALTRACMFTLARSPRSALSAVEISDQLRGQLSITPCGPDRILTVLRNASVFEQSTRGRFQLGSALARRGAADGDS